MQLIFSDEEIMLLKANARTFYAKAPEGSQKDRLAQYFKETYGEPIELVADVPAAPGVSDDSNPSD